FGRSQWQSGETEAGRSENSERQEHLSGRGDAEKTVRHPGPRSGDAACHQPAVDQGEDGEVTALLSFRDGAQAPDPESRDSGFDAAHRPGMTVLVTGSASSGARAAKSRMSRSYVRSP